MINIASVIQKERNKARRIISSFLDSQFFLEVETPILSKNAIPESSIKLFSTIRKTMVKNDDFYLLPSPELYMKRILFEWNESIYQFSKCFRNAEQISKEHCNEFLMLEFYKIGEDEQGQAKRTQKLFEILFDNFPGDADRKKQSGFRYMSMKEAVLSSCNINLDEVQSVDVLRKKLQDIGVTVYDKGESWADSFNRLFVAVVEPNLPCNDMPLLLYDYPSQIDCLAKEKESLLDEGKYKKRWELYYKGIELANCYCEETRRDEILKYIKKEDSIILRDERGFHSDYDLAEFSPLPNSSGVALGFDRLMMILLDKSDIRQVLPFYENLL